MYRRFEKPKIREERAKISPFAKLKFSLIARSRRHKQKKEKKVCLLISFVLCPMRKWTIGQVALIKFAFVISRT